MRRVRKRVAVIDQPTNRHGPPARIDRFPIRRITQTRIIPTKARDHKVRLQVIDVASQPRQTLMTRVARHRHRKHFNASIRIRIP